MVSYIELRALSKQYKNECVILSGVNHIFYQGNSYALTGISGTGKSTLLHMLALLENPTSGTILYNGANICTFNDMQKQHYLQSSVGILLQNPLLLHDLTIIENVLLPGLLAGQPWSQSYARASKLLQDVHLLEKAEHFPSELSGGQQQRASLARALFHKPAFILADEPTGNLDKNTGAAIIELLLQHQSEYNAGLIISTHDTELVSKMQYNMAISNKKLSEFSHLQLENASQASYKSLQL